MTKTTMDYQKINAFQIIGISVRTTNEKGQSGKDIAELWNKFMAEHILEQIPNKVGSTIYSVYTAYEKDHTKPYTTLLGCEVNSLATIPEGMVGKVINAGNYVKRSIKGNILEGLVLKEWIKIWNSSIPRAYTADFEVYGNKAQNPESAEVDIFVAV